MKGPGSGQAFDGFDVGIFQMRRFHLHQTRSGNLSIENYRAGSAMPSRAAVLRTFKSQVVSQIIKETAV